MNKYIPHIASIVVIFIVTFAYFSPVLSGKKLGQNDVNQWEGMSKEIRDYRETTGEEPLWTNSMFGGMPAYQISMEPHNNLNWVRRAINNIFPEPTNIMLVGLVCCYLMFIVLGVNPWLALAGSLTWGFSTYNVLIIEAGHITKFWAMSFMPLVIAGIIMAYKNKQLLSGAAVAGLGLGLQISCNHYQITYYTLLIALVLFIAYLIEAIKNKQLQPFAIASLLLGSFFVLGVASDAGRILTTYEYSKETIRGGSELSGEDKNSSGLSADYALDWSYGIGETMTLLIPRFVGGASNEPISRDTETAKILKRAGQPSKNGPMYWGAQPFTGGPIYHGAIIVFLFLLGCFVVKGTLRWALIAVTLLSVMLAWGKNFMPLTGFFFNFFPMYDKFRVVSMILVIAQLSMPLLGILGLQQIISGGISKEEAMKSLKISVGILGGLLLLIIIAGAGFMDFSTAQEAQYPEQFQNALMADRAAMLRADAIRSLAFILLAAAGIWAFLTQKINQLILIGVVGALAFVDLVTVDIRYLDSKDFKSERKVSTILQPTPADKQILNDQDPNFRVLNMRNPFNDAITSYHHKSVGGYHGAKLSRYQDLIEKHFSEGINQEVIDMLNTKYVIGGANATDVQRNPGALGNAWFVSNIKIVNNADEEIAALNEGFNARTTAIIDKRFSEQLNGFTANADSIASIQLTEYSPNQLSYKSRSSKENLAVFSEIYYRGNKDWKAYIDGEPAQHLRANYVLRAMRVPAGEHTITFKFEPASYQLGTTVGSISSILLLLLALGAIAYPYIMAANKEENKM